MEIFPSCIDLITLCPPFLTKTPAVIKLSISLLIPLTGRSIPAPSCLLPLLLSFHLAIHLFLHPSLTLDIYPHFSTPRNWCIWRRGPPRLSPSLPLHPSAVSYPRRLSSSRFSEMDLLLVLFSLSWVNTEDSAELPADLLFSICWAHLAGFALLCFFFYFCINYFVQYCSAGVSACTCTPERPLLTLTFN